MTDGTQFASGDFLPLSDRNPRLADRGPEPTRAAPPSAVQDAWQAGHDHVIGVGGAVVIAIRLQ